MLMHFKIWELNKSDTSLTMSKNKMEAQLKVEDIDNSYFLFIKLEIIKN